MLIDNELFSLFKDVFIFVGFIWFCLIGGEFLLCFDVIDLVEVIVFFFEIKDLFMIINGFLLLKMVKDLY